MRQAANTAIVELIQGKDFKNCISKIEPKHLQDDLASEVYLILLETNPGKIVDLHQNKQLNFYAARIIMNLAFSNTSPFYKKFRHSHKCYIDNGIAHYEAENELVFGESEVITKIIEICDNSNEDINRHKEELLALDAITGLYWYDAEIVRLFLEYGNYRAVAKETRIPFTSIYYTIQKAAKDIKQKVKSKELPNDAEINLIINKLTAIKQETVNV